MPCHYQIFQKENLVAKTFFGRVTTKCVLNLLDNIESDQKYRDGMLEFDDLSNVADLAITATDIARFADLIVGLNRRKRLPTKKAILAGPGPGRAAAYGFCKMVEGAKGIEVKVFEEYSEALPFLDISSDECLRRFLAVRRVVN